jgi:hypothetical protein
MSNPGRSSSGAAVRIGLIAILAVAAVAFFRVHGRSISEDQVRGILASHELVGMPVAAAALKLEHRVSAIDEGEVACEFDQAAGWTAGPVILVVKDGNVTSAFFEHDRPKDH